MNIEFNQDSLLENALKNFQKQKKMEILVKQQKKYYKILNNF